MSKKLLIKIVVILIYFILLVTTFSLTQYFSNKYSELSVYDEEQKLVLKDSQGNRFQILKGGFKIHGQQYDNEFKLKEKVDLKYNISLASFLILAIGGGFYLILLVFRFIRNIASNKYKMLDFIKQYLNNILICAGVFTVFFSFFNIRVSRYKVYAVDIQAIFFTALGVALLVLGNLGKIDEKRR